MLQTELEPDSHCLFRIAAAAADAVLSHQQSSVSFCHQSPTELELDLYACATLWGSFFISLSFVYDTHFFNVCQLIPRLHEEAQMKQT